MAKSVKRQKFYVEFRHLNFWGEDGIPELLANLSGYKLFIRLQFPSRPLLGILRNGECLLFFSFFCASVLGLKNVSAARVPLIPTLVTCPPGFCYGDVILSIHFVDG